MLGDQVARAMKRAAVDPTRLEAEGIELGPKHVTHATHAGQIQRAAVDVDDLLEQRELLRGMGVDGPRDRLFVGGEGGALGRHGMKTPRSDAERGGELEDASVRHGRNLSGRRRVGRDAGVRSWGAQGHGDAEYRSRHWATEDTATATEDTATADSSRCASGEAGEKSAQSAGHAPSNRRTATICPT